MKPILKSKDQIFTAETPRRREAIRRLRRFSPIKKLRHRLRHRRTSWLSAPVSASLRLCGLFVLLLAGCAGKKPVVVKMPPAVPGTMLTTADMESVRYSENMKAYPIGRYVDPNNGLMMHEAHTIYRVETTAKWNLHPDVYPYAPGNLPGGPVVGIIDPAHRDSPITPEVVAEIDRQKIATQALMAQSRRMDQTLNQLSKVLPATAQVAEENARLKAQAQATERRLEILEEQFRKQQIQAQTETEFTPPAAFSVKGTNDW